MKKFEAAVYSLLVTLVVLFVPCNLPAQGEIDVSFSSEIVHETITDASDQNKIRIAQDDGNEPCCYNAPQNLLINNEDGIGILLAQDDGNEPCCYNALNGQTLSIEGQNRILVAQDDGNEPCCYGALHNSILDLDGLRGLQLAAKEPNQTELISSPPVPRANHASAVTVTTIFREKVPCIVVVDRYKLVTKQS